MSRIQRQRTKGWRMPPNTVYVGRPSRWGNPFSGWTWTPTVVDAYREWVSGFGPEKVARFVEPLRGHDLACWCPLDQPCHADVLLELVA